jgi:16S rRNA (uracil1498-N3)-methyltransferase
MMPKYRHEYIDQFMRLTRCYVPASLHAGDTLSLPESASAHIGRVLRARAGDALTIFNGHGGEYDAQILTIERRSVRVRIGAYRAIERESPLKVTLLQALARGERMDFIVQKATELGVAAIVTLPGARSVVRLDEEGHQKRREHLHSVAISACEQCGRNRLPTIELAGDLAAAIARSPQGDRRLLLAPDAAQTLVALIGQASGVTLLVGPEGGFADDELALSQQHGFKPCRLGPRVLRAETAPLAALAAIQALAGDLGN